MCPAESIVIYPFSIFFQCFMADHWRPEGICFKGVCVFVSCFIDFTYRVCITACITEGEWLLEDRKRNAIHFSTSTVTLVRNRLLLELVWNKTDVGADFMSKNLGHETFELITLINTWELLSLDFRYILLPYLRPLNSLFFSLMRLIYSNVSKKSNCLSY